MLAAVLCGVSAPLAEVVLMNVWGLWHYPIVDVFVPGAAEGFPSWVTMCYFQYTVYVVTLARALLQAHDLQQQRSSASS